MGTLVFVVLACGQCVVGRSRSNCGLCNESAPSLSRLLICTSIMADMDVFAAMGISGFGKATVKKQLDPSRFDKNKREEVSSMLVRCLRHDFRPPFLISL